MAAIGVLTLELRLENSHSLKGKRHVGESLQTRLRNKFNVAGAEIDYQDLWQRAAVAAVTVSADRTHAANVLRSVEDEAAELFNGVRASTDTFIAARAPALTLGELVRLLGHRAELLADLWNEWPAIRPLLFSTSL